MRHRIAAACILLCTIAGSYSVSAQSLATPFTLPLPIPPLAENRSPETGDVSVFLDAAPGEIELFGEAPTATYGYNGNYLGPTIRVRRGDDVSISVDNNLHEVTTVHWHGLHVPAEMDGGPHQTIEPGARWTARFTVDQPAATLWYHPHALGLTGEHVYRGLAGLLIIDDDLSDSLRLPSEYGVDDIPLVIQDRRFDTNGQFVYVRSAGDVMHGVVGNVLLVNGGVQPFKDVSAQLIRFRILNGSNAGIYRVSMGDDRSFQMVASDGGFLAAPVSMTEVILSPGERAEIVVDFSTDEVGSRTRIRVEQYNGGVYDALEVRVAHDADPAARVAEQFGPVEEADPAAAQRTRQFVMETRGMGVFTINGRRMDMERVDVRVPRGTTEIWEISNRGMGMMQIPHSFHVHDVQFRILSRNGTPPPEHERGRKDTVLIWPGETVRIVAEFRDYTGIYMYHCHILEHEDAGMMGQFEVYEE